ncbi:MAG: 3'-5' exonuclease [Paramuribaculum sp.]|nr:3'-5' exonuclease [Paramuribaculum sp.]
MTEHDNLRLYQINRPYKNIPKLHGNFAAIDFETANGMRSSVCSVGIVIVRNGEIDDRFYSLIRPRPNYYTEWTTAIHGLDHYDTDFADNFPQVWSRIAHKLQNLPLVAHNKPFDESCLKAVFREYRMTYPNYEFHCTLAASRRYLRLPNHQLHTVAAACGFDLRAHHNALADAEACAAIALRLL